MMLGKQRPTRLVMEDALRKGEQSVLGVFDNEAERSSRQNLYQGLFEKT